MARAYFIKAGEQVYESNDTELKNYLMKARDSGSNSVAFNPNTQGFTQRGPICDLTRISAVDAAKILERMDKEQATNDS